MAEVAYLLGAGASAESVPIVSQLAENIKGLKEKIAEILNPSQHVFTLGPSYKKINDIFRHLTYACEQHSSVDTYAKKLYLTDKDAFFKFKKELSLYFSLQQIVYGLDKRYDNFFASILDSDISLPNRISIISWNYDSQIELAYSNYLKQKSLITIRERLNSIATCEANSCNIDSNKFCLIKLNGSARIHNGEEYIYLIKNLEEDIKRKVTFCLDTFLTDYEGAYLKNSELQFAWEKENHIKLFEAINDKLSKIEEIIVIGYSFPYFNRIVDEQLFKKMIKLRKIYIQDINPSGIKEVLKEFIDIESGHKGSIEVELRNNINQFLFPKTLDIHAK